MTPIHWRHTGGMTMPEVLWWVSLTGLFWYGMGLWVGVW